MRGYDRAAVDALVAHLEAAIREDSEASRTAARAHLDAEVAKGLPIALRGYDRGQVDMFLKSLSERLAHWEEP